MRGTLSTFSKASKIIITNITRILSQNCVSLSLQCAALHVKPALFCPKILRNILALLIFLLFYPIFMLLYTWNYRFLMFFYLFVAEFDLCATSKYFDFQFDLLFVFHYLEYCTDKIFERSVYHFYAFANDEQIEHSFTLLY